MRGRLLGTLLGVVAVSFWTLPSAFGSHGGTDHCPGYEADPRDQIVVTTNAPVTGTGADEVICSIGSIATLSGEGGNDALILSKFGGTLDGGEGDDFLDGTKTAPLSDPQPGVYYDHYSDFLAGPGNDTIDLGGNGASTDTAHGGSGNDEIVGGDGFFTYLYGDEGNDRLVASSGGGNESRLFGGEDQDVLVGGRDDDRDRGDGPWARMDGGPGLVPDVFVGTEGSEGISYEGRVEDLHIDFDGLADDGAAGEGDRIGAAVEGASGGSGDDVLIGGSDRNFLGGGDGDDYLKTDRGPLEGANGGAGDDLIDTRDFGPVVPWREVQLAANATPDGFANGENGEDGWTSLGVPDSYTCREPGAPDGVDLAMIDPGDWAFGLRPDPPGGCEEVRESKVEIKTNGEGYVLLPLACPETENSGCKGWVKLFANGVASASAAARPGRVIAEARYRIRRGRHRRVKAPLDPHYLRALRHQKAKRRPARVVLRWLGRRKQDRLERHRALVRKPKPHA